MNSEEKLVLKKLLPLLKPHRRRLAFAVLCMIACSAFTALTAYLIKPAMDDIFVKKNVTMLMLIPVIFLVVSFLLALSKWGNNYLLKSVGLSVIARLREMVYNHAQDLPLSFFDRNSTGILMSRIDRRAGDPSLFLAEGTDRMEPAVPGSENLFRCGESRFLSRRSLCLHPDGGGEVVPPGSDPRRFRL